MPTGALLLISYPTKALTNPVFYTKLLIIGFAIWVLTKQQKVLAGTAVTEADMARGAALAKWSLVLWVGAISTGRLLAYTLKGSSQEFDRTRSLPASRKARLGHLLRHMIGDDADMLLRSIKLYVNKALRRLRSQGVPHVMQRFVDVRVFECVCHFVVI